MAIETDFDRADHQRHRRSADRRTGLIFRLASGPTPFWRKFARVLALLCYFVPAIYNTAGLIDGSQGVVYNPIASRVLLPVALVLLTMTIDLRGVLRLGPKLLFVFCMGTLGIALGAIVSFQLFEWLKPDVVAGDVWKGMAALAGSWIGGGANMVAVRELYGVDATLFGQFAVVDVAVANLWMATLLFLAGRAATIDARSGADTRAIDEMKARLEAYEAANARIPTLTDLMVILGVGFGIVGLAHAVATPLAAWFAAHVPNAARFSLDSSFVWVVVGSTVAGLLLSFTPVRRLENAGMARIGSACLYFLIASIGMQMDFLHGRPAVAAAAGRGGWRCTSWCCGARQAGAGAAVLLRDRLAGQHRRRGLGAGGGDAFHRLWLRCVLLGTVGYATGTWSPTASARSCVSWPAPEPQPWSPRRGADV